MVGLKSPWQLAECHKAFVVSGNHVHFGCRGDQSPSSQVSKQWEPQTAVSSSLGLISVTCPHYCLDRNSFYTFHPPQDTLMIPNKDEQLSVVTTARIAVQMEVTGTYANEVDFWKIFKNLIQENGNRANKYFISR